MEKYKRTQFFIDKEIQGKYMVSFAIPLLSVLLLFIILFYFALTYGINQSIKLLENDMSEQVSFSMMNKSEISVKEYQFLVNDLQNKVATFSEEHRGQEVIIKSLLWLILPGFFILIVQLLLLTVFFSHKLAGPIYRLELACKRIIAGDYSERVNLRTGDQLTRLADLFNQVIGQSNELITDLLESDSKEDREEKVKNITL